MNIIIDAIKDALNPVEAESPLEGAEKKPEPKEHETAIEKAKARRNG